MNLLIDIGNTSCKIARYDALQRLSLQRVSSNSDIMELAGGNYDTIVLSSVRDADPELNAFLKGHCNRFIDFNLEWVRKSLAEGNAALKCLDNMPEGMGADRMAAILMACTMMPDEDIILFDFGTAITIEFISRSRYEGGVISLGLTTRYRALSDYTRKIPVLDPHDILSRGDINTLSTVGYNLDTALAAGNILGIKFEIEGYLRTHPRRKVIFAGGDAQIFAAGISAEKVVDPNLVLGGLSHIALA